MREILDRADELATIESFLDALQLGPGVLVIEGDAGIGKTTLWSEALRQAAVRGVAVLSSRPVAADATHSFAALADLTASVDGQMLQSLPDPQRRALDVALLRAESLASSLDPRAVSTGFLSVLANLSELRPVVVAIDDVHWIDRSSAGAVEFAVRRLGACRVGLLVTRRSDEPEPFPLGPTGAGALTRLLVGPLGAEALRQLLSRSLRGWLGRPALARIARASGGNPLFALEIARAVVDAERQRTDHVLPIPDSLQQLLQRRIAHLRDPTKEALLIAAAVAEPTIDLLDLSALAEAEEAAIVRVDTSGRVRFTHPLLASAVYASASTVRRRAVHRRLAERLTDPEERARHLALATVRPSARVAAALEEGARAVRERGAPAAAAELLDEARRVTPSPDEDSWARRCMLAIRWWREAGDWGRASELAVEAVGRLRRGPARAAILVEQGYLQLDATHLCEQALEEAGDDQMIRASALLMLAMHKMQRLDFRGGQADAGEALRAARALPDRGLAGMALMWLAIIELMGGIADPTERCSRARELEAELGPFTTVANSPATYLAAWAMWNDRPMVARGQLEAQIALARELGDETSELQVRVFLCELEWRAGDWQRMSEQLDKVFALVEVSGFALAESAVRYQRGLHEACRGDLNTARETLAEGLAISEQLDEHVFATMHRGVRAFVELSAEEPAAALREIEAIRARLSPDREPVWTHFQGDELEALIAVGELERAAERIASLERLGREEQRDRLLAWAARGRGLLLAARGDVAGALTALEEAVAANGRLAVPFELGRTLLVKGQIERRARRKAAARDSLDHAIRIFTDLGAGVWLAKAQANQARIGLRRAPDGLTEGERAVAELAAAGHTNREIAVRLFMSPRTVEANLARAYRKLRVSSRAELGARVALGRNARETASSRPHEHVEITDSSTPRPP